MDSRCIIKTSSLAFNVTNSLHFSLNIMMKIDEVSEHLLVIRKGKEPGIFSALDY